MRASCAASKACPRRSQSDATSPVSGPPGRNVSSIECARTTARIARSSSCFSRSHSSHITSLPLRRGPLAACWTAFLTEVPDMMGRHVEDTRTCAAGSAAEPHASRLIAGCWLRLAHHSLFTAAFGSAWKQQCSPVRISLYPFGCSGQHNAGHSAKRNGGPEWSSGRGR